MIPHAFTPGRNGDTVASAFQLTKDMAERAKHFARTSPHARNALTYFKAHPRTAAAAAVGALWLVKKILRSR